MVHPTKRFIAPLLFFLTLSLVAQASNMVEGDPKKAEVVAAKLTDAKKNHWELSVRLLEHPAVQPSGFYDASKYKKGTIVKFVVEYSKYQFKVGDALHVRWMSYSAMGANGPVGGLSWQFVSKP